MEFQHPADISALGLHSVSVPDYGWGYALNSKLLQRSFLKEIYKDHWMQSSPCTKRDTKIAFHLSSHLASGVNWSSFSTALT